MSGTSTTSPFPFAKACHWLVRYSTSMGAPEIMSAPLVERLQYLCLCPARFVVVAVHHCLCENGGIENKVLVIGPETEVLPRSERLRFVAPFNDYLHGKDRAVTVRPEDLIAIAIESPADKATL
jgi:hypothetical protein